ncbi:pyruvate dehydrogenase (acetyl-transferring) E1 component subunit alpha [Candidatus Poribacteria bacterium]|nr:pyruvate dehydrogenase (acetyl-transferring) E1 component subunit alpha [Candidatus Poribacteria bacterium]
MPNIFDEYHPLTGKIFRILDENGVLHEEHAPKFSLEELRGFYRWIIFSRVADQKALNLQRQGRMGTYAPVLGQEGIQIGAASAMQPQDWLFPSYRELAASMIRGLPLANIYLYWMGNEEGSRIPEGVNIFPISVPVGTHPLHAVGAAWASKLRREKIVVVCFFGDGATSEGDFHEALNFAGVFKTPNVFICQNNQYAISVPFSRQSSSPTIAQKAIAYGFDGIRVDGNDIFASYVASKAAIDKARSGGGPTFIEAVTFRLGAHTTADDPRRYRTDAEVEEWRKREPLVRFEKYLREKRIIDDGFAAQVKSEAERAVEETVTQVEAVPSHTPNDVFAYMFSEMPQNLKEQLALLNESLSVKREILFGDTMRHGVPE